MGIISYLLNCWPEGSTMDEVACRVWNWYVRVRGPRKTLYAPCIKGTYCTALTCQWIGDDGMCVVPDQATLDEQAEREA